ncbi:MAG TPA: protein kinase [Ktedonobacteraceae bacterium]|nr:protein kinase [Ktedonobacteraceae bacterium]
MPSLPAESTGNTGSLSQQKAIPHRPRVTAPLNQVLDPEVFQLLRQQPVFQAPKLLTSSEQQKGSAQSPTSAFEMALFSVDQDDSSPQDGPPPLGSNTLLRGGRYRLREVFERQNWQSGVYETIWQAQDAQRSMMSVMICELYAPESSSIVVQEMLRTATIALTSVGRYPHVPTLWDVFSERDRNFFVFEPVYGESLVAHMRRIGLTLPEREIIECCVQIAELLELISQQTPPLVHGLIQPEHIVIKPDGQYVLRNFSVVLAGGATQFVTGLERASLSPYIAPELTQGLIDVRADLYSLLATAYYTVTGKAPVRTEQDGDIASARIINPRLSPLFDVILSRGLHAAIEQRYQRPSELRRDLLAILPMNMRGRVQNTGSYMYSPPALPSPRVSGVLSQSQPGLSISSPGLSGTQFPQVGDSSIGRSLIQKLPETEPEKKRTNQEIYWIIGIGAVLVFLLLIHLLFP